MSLGFFVLNLSFVHVEFRFSTQELVQSGQFAFVLFKVSPEVKLFILENLSKDFGLRFSAAFCTAAAAAAAAAAAVYFLTAFRGLTNSNTSILPCFDCPGDFAHLRWEGIS